MKSSWVWMMALVALGSGLIRAQPQIDLQKLNGEWYPLAIAKYNRYPRNITEYRIQSNDTQSFDLFFPEESKYSCKEERYTYIAKEGGVFQRKDGFHSIIFADTDYDSYLIMAGGYPPKRVLYLYARKKVLTEEMKAKFQSQVAKMGFKEKNIHYRPEIFYC